MLGAIGAVMLLAAPAGEISPAGPLDPKAEEIIARTRATLSTYAIYWRVRIEGGSSGPEYA